MRRNNYLATSVMAFIFLLYHVGGYAAEHRTGRYTTIALLATDEQKNPLNATVHTTFPNQVRLIGGALRQILDQSGYRLAHRGASDPRLPSLLSAPLPNVQRNLGPLQLHDALITLAGEPWELVIDPVHRLVSFDLKRPYAGSVSMLSRPCEPLKPELHAQE